MPGNLKDNDSSNNQPNETTPLIKYSKNEEEIEGLDANGESNTIELDNAKSVSEKFIELMTDAGNNINTSVACLVPVNIPMSIFPELFSSTTRLSASAASALAASLARALFSVWEHYNKNNTGPNKCCSFKSFVDFLKSPIGAPVCSYTMLLCFRTLGHFAPQLPDNAAMLSLISTIFAVSLLNGVLTHLGAKSEVNPLSKITRRDVALGMAAGVTAAGSIEQVNRLIKQIMDPPTYETFSPYMLPAELIIGFIYGMGRIIIPALKKFQESPTYEKEDALLMMNTVKNNWDAINSKVRVLGNIFYIAGTGKELIELLSEEHAIAIFTVILAGPVTATVVDAIARKYCSPKPKVSSLITSFQSPVFSGSIQDEKLPHNKEEQSEEIRIMAV